MNAEQADGIVLRVTEFSETSCIVWWFTREFGRIDTLAKGARRRRNPFEGALDLLARSRLVFLRKSSDALDLLTEAKLERLFRAGRRDLDRLQCGFHVAELLTRFFDRYDPHAAFYDRMSRAVDRIETDGDLPLVVTRLELDLLGAIGVAPSWDRCVDCGTEVALQRRLPFSTIDGGVVCGRCRSGRHRIVSVRDTTIRFLQRLESAETDETGFGEGDLPEGWGEIRGLMGQLLQHRHGSPLRVLPTLGFLSRSRSLR
ncbi:MAG TPA: DNA repair protein RecO [Pirellulaceae bacterium]|nr:DNA repair protein RecO [Pirellulaceae bacterium]